jgi:glycosyltransferase involved in cell wall biosynthesis
MKPGLFGRLPHHVEVVGQVKDVRPSLREARVAVCPVFFGGGVPNKVLESAAAGRPTVISPYVARTLGNAEGFSVAEHPRDWARHLIKYLGNPVAADAAGLASYRNVKANYGISCWQEDMLTLEGFARADSP